MQADAGGQVDEFPNDGNNTKFVELYVRPQPLPDLVMGGVVVPAQVVEGATIEVRYTVTNLGPGTTDGRRLDRHRLADEGQEPAAPRPGRHPAEEPAAPRQRWPTGTGYDVITTVQVPEHLVSGTYYVTPWTDPYDVVPEDTLAVNVNPDDPNEIDNNNYKAGRSDGLGTHGHRAGHPQARPVRHLRHGRRRRPWAGRPTPSPGRSSNKGHGPANGSWTDEVWLTDDPNPRPEQHQRPAARRR